MDLVDLISNGTTIASGIFKGDCYLTLGVLPPTTTTTYLYPTFNQEENKLPVVPFVSVARKRLLVVVVLLLPSSMTITSRAMRASTTTPAIRTRLEDRFCRGGGAGEKFE